MTIAERYRVPNAIHFKPAPHFGPLPAFTDATEDRTMTDLEQLAIDPVLTSVDVILILNEGWVRSTDLL